MKLKPFKNCTWHCRTMEKPPAKVMGAFSLKTRRTEIPKVLASFFLILQLLFGIDCGFSATLKPRLRRYFQAVSTFSGLMILGLVITPLFKQSKVWYWCQLIKLINLTLILKTTRYTAYDFLCDCYEMGDGVPGLNTNVFGTVISTYTVLTYVIKQGLMASFTCFELSECEVNEKMFEMSALLIVDIISGVLVVIVYYLYSFIKDIRQRFESERNLKDLEKRYAALVECHDQIKTIYDRMIITELLLNTPRLISTLWLMLLFIKQKYEWYAYINELMAAAHLTVQLCAPAVLGQLVISEVEYIVKMLHNQLRVETDPVPRAELHRVLRFMRGRRLLPPACRVLPLDLRLPIALVSHSTTYFIIILQFTHVFD